MPFLLLGYLLAPSLRGFVNSITGCGRYALSSIKVTASVFKDIFSPVKLVLVLDPMLWAGTCRGAMGP